MSGTISPRDRLQLWVNTFLLKQKENSGSVTATFRDLLPSTLIPSIHHPVAVYSLSIPLTPPFHFNPPTRLPVPRFSVSLGPESCSSVISHKVRPSTDSARNVSRTEPSRPKVSRKPKTFDQRVERPSDTERKNIGKTIATSYGGRNAHASSRKLPARGQGGASLEKRSH